MWVQEFGRDAAWPMLVRCALRVLLIRDFLIVRVGASDPQ